MNALTFKLEDVPDGGLDLSPLVPTALAGKTPDQIARIRLKHGSGSSRAGELFTISGSDAAHLRFSGLTAACHRLGAGLDGGLIEARGNHGVELGRGMRSGEIRFSGDCGEALGAGMRGGVIRVRGNAGDRVGGTVAGEVRGMNEGAILIDGDAGDCVGERMRRGLIVVAGNAGAFLGSRMIAGTIAVLGACGNAPGAGMRRGTLLLATPPARLPPTFNAAGEFELAFVPILARHVGGLSRRYGREIGRFARAARYAGDMAFGGKGELLIPAER